MGDIIAPDRVKVRIKVGFAYYDVHPVSLFCFYVVVHLLLCAYISCPNGALQPQCLGVKVVAYLLTL